MQARQTTANLAMIETFLTQPMEENKGVLLNETCQSLHPYSSWANKVDNNTEQKSKWLNLQGKKEKKEQIWNFIPSMEKRLEETQSYEY